MSDESHNDIFGLRLNGQGIRYIIKFAVVAKYVILTTLIGSLFFFITGMGRILNDTVDYSEFDFLETVYLKTYPFFNVIIDILSFFQLYYYWKMKKLLEEAISDKNEILFNDSFKALLKNAIWGLLLGAVFLIFAFIDLLFWTQYY